MKLKTIKLKFLFLCITQVCNSQTVEVNQLMNEGRKAFLENNFVLAKEIYTKAKDLDGNNKDCWFNLAATELKLEENENACEHFYQAYLLNDGEALTIIKEICPDLKKGSIMSINDVEEKPKFIYKTEEYVLVENNNLSSKYRKILTNRLKKSKIMSKYKGSLFIQFQINNSNALDAKILRVSGDPKEAEIIRIEMLSILNNLVTYVSAKNKGVNINLWEKWFFTLNFLMTPY